MATATLHELNHRYVRLSDRARSQWTFYQFLQAVFKHLVGTPCPVELDYQGLFARLRELSGEIGQPGANRAEPVMTELSRTLNQQARTLLEVDGRLSPSVLRRFFDRLRHQDGKVLLAVAKFYLDIDDLGDTTMDKLDVLLTRLAEIPREDGGSLAREHHELERLVQPLLQYRRPPATPEQEVSILLEALAELRAKAMSTRTFTELVAGGVPDRFRALKKRLGESYLDPRLLPAVLETGVALKNRFRELWEEEEPQILDDTNRVMDFKRHLDANPDMLTPELQKALDGFASLHRRFDQGRQEETLRREDVLQLRRALTSIMEQFDAVEKVARGNGQGHDPAIEQTRVTLTGDTPPPPPVAAPRPAQQMMPSIPSDPLLQEYFGKIIFALELIDTDRPAEEIAQAKELSSLHLEPWEIEAAQIVASGGRERATIDGEQEFHFFQTAALRIRMDEEAREVIRLTKRGSDRLAELLDRATQSLQRAAELDRRFQWFIDDALYRGDTGHLEHLYRSRFRLLRAFSGLWLIHNERGGLSPL